MKRVKAIFRIISIFILVGIAITNNYSNTVSIILAILLLVILLFVQPLILNKIKKQGTIVEGKFIEIDKSNTSKDIATIEFTYKNESYFIFQSYIENCPDVGAKVTVWVDNNDISNSIIAPEEISDIFLYVILGFIAVGILIYRLYTG